MRRSDPFPILSVGNVSLILQPKSYGNEDRNESAALHQAQRTGQGRTVAPHGQDSRQGKEYSIAQFSCKFKVDVRLWNSTTQRCTGKSRMAVMANREIERTLLLLRQRFNELKDIKEIVSAEGVKNAYQGQAESQDTIMKLFAEHNEEYALRVGVNRAVDTYYQYMNTYRHLAVFLKDKYRLSDMPVKRFKPRTIVGHINRLKCVMMLAVFRGVIPFSPFKGYRPQKPEFKQMYLTEEELAKFANMTYDTPNRNFTRDMFLFSCRTGICYCDMRALTEKNLVKAEDGSLWIHTERLKTGTPECVRLMEIPLAILEKYKGMDADRKLLPMLTKERMNRRLKKMSVMCGINRPISFHQARHTFGSIICLSQGIPIETVSKIMGHKHIKTTQRYAKVTQDKIDRDVDDILKSEFGTSQTEPNVHILDPFVGTGTFITRLLQSSLIRPEDMDRKYLNEIHCNEIVLLAYYIADVNIESVFHDITRRKTYLPYSGICLTDTFQLAEKKHNELFTEFFQDNSKRVKKQMATHVRVIVGNPPYSIGQKSDNDNAQNLSYPVLDARIIKTYRKESNNKSALAVAALRDSYVKAFRWASDRISKDEGGIVAFISNGAWLDGVGQDGMRRCFEEEFTSIYVLNLRGNQRTSGGLSRKEGGKIFGSGSRTPIAITFLVKNPAKKGQKAVIYYHDIGDYLTREQKLKIVKESRSISSQKLDWQIIAPNEKADWINQRDGVFDSLIPLAPSKKFSTLNQSVFCTNLLGVCTNRDSWAYNFSLNKLKFNVCSMMNFYNSEMERTKSLDSLESLDKLVCLDSTKMSWTARLKIKANKRFKFHYSESDTIRYSLYRPFTKTNMYFDRDFNENIGLSLSIYPVKGIENITICVSGIGTGKGFSVVISKLVSDLQLLFNGQSFPLYWYEENRNREGTLFDDTETNRYIRCDGITDWILKEVRNRFGGSQAITKNTSSTMCMDCFTPINTVSVSPMT